VAKYSQGCIKFAVICTLLFMTTGVD
jgi:hypothetical protein